MADLAQVAFEAAEETSLHLQYLNGFENDLRLTVNEQIGPNASHLNAIFATIAAMEHFRKQAAMGTEALARRMCETDAVYTSSAQLGRSDAHSQNVLLSPSGQKICV